jgi:hypothetical protein
MKKQPNTKVGKVIADHIALINAVIKKPQTKK